MAFEAYLKLDGIQTSEYNGIPLEGFSWGASNPGAPASGQESGVVSFTDFSFTSNVGQHSPQLLEACASGQHITSALLTITGAPEAIYMKFTDVFVANYTINEQALSTQAPAETFAKFDKFGKIYTAAPMDAVSLNFSKIEYNFGGTIGTGGGSAAS